MLNLTISGPFDRPEVTLDGGRRACIDSLSVYEADMPGKPIWTTSSKDGRCVMVRSLVYGETPEQFVDESAPAPLRHGVIYEALGRGNTTGPFGGVPWSGGVRFHFEGDQWTVADATEANGGF